ncbi:TPA: UDP-N-acetylglucosamine 1-carboxyvinyltransferase [Vibrio vulnificus]|uniref:UDP-N-acetylglucosamine 1-carboxyvinyltransferase n=1 Tax=Vibrio vulnificus TaxID=672 RepID=UPI0009294F50|nr:UDP-N-acetylglucosamine 1-carboxyvinyltransferase [Vibrio vulnificus]OJI55342.1 UDP-N-acetylglucosamine 1-carboxyvinyltransferase [Vibrio vulnificus]OJI56085.1 UDP-N-acetylglucosamine 1-carboxyvinyltransferase [Vibrio fluvialis]POB24204.1 UDP-N-acetylglucosamine 1-carboxyvinyltransferase [Vibrio vulnificus]
MGSIAISKRNEINGYVDIEGSKNSFLSIFFASIALKQKTVLYNVPSISDLYYGLDILDRLSVSYAYNPSENCLKIDSSKVKKTVIDEHLLRKFRASVYITGAMIARFGKSEIFEPGGCKIGLRPINFHIDCLRELGCNISQLDDGKLYAVANETGGKVIVPQQSVGATVNTILASINCSLKTEIFNYAPEPEIDDLIEFLSKSGVNIHKSSRCITIVPCSSDDYHDDLVEHEIIPDRIEAVSYVVLGLVNNSYLTINNINIDHLSSTLDLLNEMGVVLETGVDFIKINPRNRVLKSVSFETGVYPKIPTDTQAQLTLLNLHAEGDFTVKENIFENRYLHVPELKRLGYDIFVEDGVVFGSSINRKTKVRTVRATDLRASITMVIAATMMSENLIVQDSYHLFRGYPKVVQKMNSIGVQIDLIQ